MQQGSVPELAENCLSSSSNASDKQHERVEQLQQGKLLTSNSVTMFMTANSLS